MRISILHFVAIFCIAVISYTTAHKSFIRLSYEINKLDIIERFCINKEKVEYSCEGKCHLMSQLEKSDQKSPSGDNHLIEENNFTLFSVHFKAILVSYKEKYTDHFSHYSTNYRYLLISNIFQPPKF